MVESSEETSVSIDQSKSDETITCPMCGEQVPADAIECPNCEEPFSPEAFEVVKEDEKKSKWLFWLGIILVIIGGPGVALGSWLHDLLQISIDQYDNFDSFGWANQLVSTVGIIILVVGIILLILSLPKLRPEDEDEVEEIVTGGQGG